MKEKKRKGDFGLTDAGFGKNIAKNHPAVKACAALDEAVCFLGLARAALSGKQKHRRLADGLKKAQEGLGLACSHVSGFARGPELEKAVAFLEKEIDFLSEKLGPAGGFVLPGSSQEEALIHCARAKCRTAETAVCGLLKTGDALKYLNRLSTYLFLAARLAALPEPVSENKSL